MQRGDRDEQLGRAAYAKVLRWKEGTKGGRKENN